MPYWDPIVRWNLSCKIAHTKSTYMHLMHQKFWKGTFSLSPAISGFCKATQHNPRHFWKHRSGFANLPCPNLKNKFLCRGVESDSPSNYFSFFASLVAGVSLYILRYFFRRIERFESRTLCLLTKKIDFWTEWCNSYTEGILMTLLKSNDQSCGFFLPSQTDREQIIFIFMLFMTFIHLTYKQVHACKCLHNSIA